MFDLGTEAIRALPAFLRHGVPPDLLQVLVEAVRAKKPDAIHLGMRAAA